MNKTLLKDALYNLASDSGASNEYCKGLVVGIVSALMATGLSFIAAMDLVNECAPEFPIERWPDAWLSEVYNREYKKRRD